MNLTAFLREADRHAPLGVCIFNVGANVNFPLLDTTERVFRLQGQTSLAVQGVGIALELLLQPQPRVQGALPDQQ
jgi:hypothetical protein